MQKPFFIFLAALVLPFVSCKKDSNGNTTPTSNADYFFIGKLDGTDSKIELTATNDIEMVNSNSSSIGPTTCELSYATSIGSSVLGTPYFEVSFPGLFSGDCGDEGLFFPLLFLTRTWAFGETKGKVTLNYYDGTDFWTSAGGAQAGSSFKVTKSAALPTPFGGDSRNVSGTVSCLLYNAAGSSKKLESGSFALNFIPYF